MTFLSEQTLEVFDTWHPIVQQSSATVFMRSAIIFKWITRFVHKDSLASVCKWDKWPRQPFLKWHALYRQLRSYSSRRSSREDRIPVDVISWYTIIKWATRICIKCDAARTIFQVMSSKLTYQYHGEYNKMDTTWESFVTPNTAYWSVMGY